MEEDNYGLNSDSENESGSPTFSRVQISLDKKEYRNMSRYNYIRTLLGPTVMDTFDPQVIKGAVDGYYTGAGELYSSEIQRLAKVLHSRGAVLSWLGRGSHISNTIRKLKQRV